MSHKSPRSLRRAYLEWVEEQVEEFKDSIPRGRLLAIADEVVNELRLSRGGQYQLTEILLCDAMNRYLFRLLKLPGYRAWCAQRALDREEPREPRVIPFPVPVQPAVAVRTPVAVVEDGAVACVG
ncbi:MAG: hypothetical protein JO306_09085 [Gemmatimonadetes bacterium]|nr:hypothetical protein [Gemmatimonadota bacterium]